MFFAITPCYGACLYCINDANASWPTPLLMVVQLVFGNSPSFYRARKPLASKPLSHFGIFDCIVLTYAQEFCMKIITSSDQAADTLKL
jgi:hypothetical protein